MHTVPATEVKNHLGRYLEAALSEPVLIEKSGRATAVLLSVAEYERLTALEDALLAERVSQADARGTLGVDATQELLARLTRRHASA
jgi:prevent-host-death family protein